MTKKRFCTECGREESEVGEFGLIPIRGYDWESNDDDALSIRRVLGYKCAERVPCALHNANVTAHNLNALREVARNSERYSKEVRDACRNTYNEFVGIANAQVKTDYMVSLENGKRC